MTLLSDRFSARSRVTPFSAAFTLVELMVASAIGLILATAVVSLTVYSARSFAAMGNYVDMDLHSRNALDVVGRELRQATAVVACQPANYVTFTNAETGTRLRLTWDSVARVLTFDKTGEPTRTLLTGCDAWSFVLYNRAPNISSTNITFNADTNVTNCKLINMSWKCSRSILGRKLNTETVQTAQIVLRNKVR